MYYYLKQYDNNNYRFISTCRNLYHFKSGTNSSQVVTDTAEIQRISRSRVKRKIREILLCNDFDYFCTWTVSSYNCDRFSLEDCQSKIRSIIQKVSRKQRDMQLGNIKYLLVTEKHEDGAFHFHGVVQNLQIGFYTNKNGYLSNEFFDDLGYQSFSPVKNKTACANYIMKYITKDSIQNEKGSYYFCSRGLKRPEKPYSIEDIDFNIFINPYGEIMFYECDYCKVCDVQLDRAPRYVLEYLYYNLKDKKYSFLEGFLKKIEYILYND